MKITVLGCGGSGGVPLIGNQWGHADPNNPKNYRTRPSIFIQEGQTSVLIDTTPDMRQQLLRENITRVTHVLFTHAHADHTNGFDDIRSLNHLLKAKIPIYADEETGAELASRFAYAFQAPRDDGFYQPSVVLNNFSEEPLKIGELTFIPIKQDHGYSTSWGFRVGDFAYNTDVKNFSDESLSALEGVKVWIVDALREEPHMTHSHLKQTLRWIRHLSPQQAYLTHMNHTVDFDEYHKKTPENVCPAWDGLVIEI
ncbi:MAG: MBL fold metallo-hydrolase [Alphaproteobacteria bacterium]|nr:MBL fold metallo-hydrolase [Alphaproteobacteria bacterium]